MVRFEGTVREFKRFVGPFLRNVVQQISREQKKALGACEHCGATGNLDAAHVHGRGRTDIINLLLGASDPAAEVDVDLADFESAFRREHMPVERAILLLCRPCHRRYDSVGAAARVGGDSTMVRTARQDGTPANGDVLPISLFPAGHEEFKDLLLDRGEAVIEILYVDGSVDRRTWRISRFTRDSNVYGNLRSRPEFRQGVWQHNGIVKVNVRVGD